MKKRKLYAMIPARFGSQRLKLKNLALINGKPMIGYSIEAALHSKIFDKIILNSDNIIFSEIAKRYGINFYLRPKKLASSKAKSDDVIADFMKNFPEADIVAWVNPIAPLQKYDDIKKIVNYYKKEKLDSLITVEKKNVHAMYDKKPINFKFDEKFFRTQDLNEVEFFSYTTMIWNSKKFLNDYITNGFAMFSGKFGSYPLDRVKSTIVKTQEDLFFIEKYIKFAQSKKNKLKYDKIIKKYKLTI